MTIEKGKIQTSINKLYTEAFDLLRLGQLYGLDKIQERIKVIREIESVLLGSLSLYNQQVKEMKSKHESSYLELINFNYDESNQV